MRRWFEQRHAPQPGTYLCDATEVDSSQVREFRFGTDTHVPFRMFLYNDAGTLRAYMNACPHFNVPLNYLPGDIFTTDRRQFLCMTHYAKFNLHDGHCTEGPCEGDGLEVIPLRFDGGRVLVGSWPQG
jgi:nitrite reductase/ring-hydroxylating ferredoxin subunit